MINRELYFRDPTTIELLNNGVSKVSEIGHDERQIRTLRFELETFVCDGEYARGLERILKAYLDGLGREEQKAVWVSGFFGSGKSHLVKVLRYLWEDYRFADGATARSLVKLPVEIADLLKELTIAASPWVACARQQAPSAQGPWIMSDWPSCNWSCDLPVSQKISPKRNSSYGCVPLVWKRPSRRP
jgi:hypothetical protein